MALSVLVMVALAQVQAEPFADLSKTYGIPIEIAKEPFTKQARGYTISGKAPTTAELEKYAPLFIKEWTLYPPSLMKKAKVTKIVICSGLLVGEQARAACPAFDLDTMYYDPAMGHYNPHYQRLVVHHEFFHMLDERMGILRKDASWSALNSEYFKYGTGGDKMREPGVGELTPDIPGFLTRYSTSAVEEDKAEIFAHLIIDTAFVKGRADVDAVLAAKIAMLKKRVADFEAGLGDKFWPSAAKSVGSLDMDMDFRSCGLRVNLESARERSQDVRSAWKYHRLGR